MLKHSDTTVVSPVTAAPNAPNMKIRSVSTITTMWPPSMFANRRMVRAAGFVNTPNSSIAGIIGIGNFSQIGTSGQKISFQ